MGLRVSRQITTPSARRCFHSISLSCQSFKEVKVISKVTQAGCLPVTHLYPVFCSYLLLNMSLHQKARIENYPRSTCKRFPVPDDKVPWDVDFPEYNPTEHTSNSVKAGPVWADKPGTSDCKFNHLDGKVDRRSFNGVYKVEDGYPRNPQGRTGLKGQGCLGRWGPNHAADPVVTKWKRNDDGSIKMAADGKPILQFIAVKRSDNNEWALPGGMVDPGETQSATLKREFGEEALNSLEATDDDKADIKRMLDDFFSIKDNKPIYAGYVDDPRNTDNSWMETVAYNFHDEKGTSVARFNLKAGDDAIGVQWMDIDKSLKLYASHINFIQEVVKQRGAHW